MDRHQQGMSGPARDEAVSPHNIEAEQQLLGALLNAPERIDQVSWMDGEMFFDPLHGAIFERLKMRRAMNRPVGVFALKEWAAQHDGMLELGGPAYLARLAGGAITSFAYKDYAGIIRDLAAKRALRDELVEQASRILNDDVTVSDVAAALEVAIMANSGGETGVRPVSIMKAATRALERVSAAQSGEGTGALASGIPSLDKLIGGFEPGDFWLIGGRPSQGKTAVALSIATRIATAGHGVVFASLEMNPDKLASRVIAERTAQLRNAVAYNSFTKGNLSEQQVKTIAQAANDVSTLPIQILPMTYREVGSLLAGAKHARQILGDQVGMKVLIVDYLQLMQARKSNRYELITEISTALKGLAGQLEIPIIALSQLSRQVESREDKRPQMSDLRESGQLEQDADGVIFCFRPEYYVEREEPSPEDMDKHLAWQGVMDDVRGDLELIVAKQRQGPVGTARVKCNVALNHIWEG